MPSVNNAGINFTVPAFLYQMQSPLPAINFSVPAFDYESQYPLPTINFSATASLYESQYPLPAVNFDAGTVLYESQTAANAAYLTEPAVTFGDQTSGDAVLLSSGTTTNVVATVNYYQRVYSSGLSVWCYYTTTGGVNQSPLSAQTTPNWTGSIAGYELITSFAV